MKNNYCIVRLICILCITFLITGSLGGAFNFLSVTAQESGLDTEEVTPMGGPVSSGGNTSLWANPYGLNLTVMNGSTTQYNLTVGNNGSLNSTFKILGSSFGGKSLLVLDGSNGGSVNAYNALVASGFKITNGSKPSSYSGTPNPSNFSGVIVFLGDDYTTDMPSAGQTALKNYVNSGGGIIFTEWFAFHILNSRYTTLSPLGCLNRTTGNSATETCTVKLSHPITQGVPSSFSTVSHGFSGCSLRSDATLLVSGSGSNSSLAFKNYSLGRVVQFATAGKYSSYDAWTDQNLTKLLVNSAFWISKSHFGVDWLNITPDNGTIGGNNKTMVTITVNATNLAPGFYQTKLFIKTNETATGFKVVWVNLTVLSGEHDIRVLSLDSPKNAEAGKSIKIESTILNQGSSNETNITIQLKINGVMKNSTNITSLKSGAKTNITFSWVPPFAGNYKVEVYAVPVTNDNTTNNQLNNTVSVSAKPHIWVNPHGFNLTAKTGELTQANLTIGNSGLAKLIYEIFRKGEIENVTICTNGASASYDDNIYNALVTLNYTFTNFGTGCPTSGYDLIIVCQDGGNALPNFNTHLNNGDHVILFGGSSSSGFLTSLGNYFNTSGSASWHTSTTTPHWVRLTSHPITKYVPAKYNFSNTQHTYHMTHLAANQPSGVTLLGRNSEPNYICGLREYASGGTFTWMGMDINWRTDSTDQTLFVEPFVKGYYEWLSGFSEVDWLTISPLNGSVSPLNKTIIQLTANASLLSPGFYQTNITIYSNDLSNKTIIIPVNFTVLSSEHDIRVLSLDAPKQGEAGKSIWVNATILNQGLSNESNITIKLRVDGIEVNNTNITSLKSGAKTVVSLSWVPMREQVVKVEIYAVPVVGENGTLNNQLNKTINIIAEPEIWNTPNYFNFTAETGLIDWGNLTIGNTGLGNLNFSLYVGEGIMSRGTFHSLPTDPMSFSASHNDLNQNYWSDGGNDAFDGYGYTELSVGGVPSGLLNLTNQSYTTNDYKYKITTDWPDRNVLRIRLDPLSGYRNDINVTLWGNLGSDTATQAFYQSFKFSNFNIRYLVTNDGTLDSTIGDPQICHFLIPGNPKDLGKVNYTISGDNPNIYARSVSLPVTIFIIPSYHKHSTIANWVKSDLIISGMAGEGVKWLEFSAENGFLFPFNSTNITVTANATKLNPGFYTTNITLVSNDDDEGFLKIPVNFTVLPAPHDVRVLSMSVPNHGEAGKTIQVNSTIYNQGTNDETNITVQLKVNGVVVNSTNISSLLKEAKTIINLTWVPMVEDNFTVEIYIIPLTGENQTHNNRLNRTISITAEPDIWVYPKGFNLTAVTGNVTSANLTIGNDGLDFLNYDIYYGSSGTKEVLFFTQYADGSPGGELENTITAINLTTTDYSSSFLDDYTKLNSSIQNVNILLIPEQERTSYSTMYNIGVYWKTTLEAFLARGGNIVVCDHIRGAYGVYTGAGLMNITGSTDATSQTVTVVSSSSPLLTNVTGTFSAPNGAAKYTTTETGVLVQQGSTPVVLSKKIKNGYITLIGFDYYSLNEQKANRIVGNSILYYGYSDFSDWLKVIPDKGKVTPLNNTVVKIIANASRLNPGVYKTNITINNNDPDKELVVIPVKFTVLPAPHDIRVYNISVPEHGETGKNISIEAAILNQGTNNETNITVQLKVDGTVKNSTVLTNLTVNEMRNITLSWVTLTEKTYTVEIHVVPIPGEDQIFNNQLNDSIIVTSEADIWLSKYKYDLKLESGVTQVHPLTVGNDGMKNLDFIIKLTEYNKNGVSTSTQGDIDDTIAYDNDLDSKYDIFDYIYIYVYSSDDDTLLVNISAYDGTTWTNLYYSTGGSRITLDGNYASKKYIMLRIVMDDTDNNDWINYQYNFTFLGQMNWLKVSPISGKLTPRTSMIVNLTVDASELEPGFYSTVIKVISNDPNEGYLVIPINLTVIRGNYTVKVIPPIHSQYSSKGNTIEYKLSVFNRGLKNDAYNLSVTGNKWTTKFYDSKGTKQISQLYVINNKTQIITVKVTIPTTANPSEIDTATMKASSQNKTGVFDTCEITTIISHEIPFIDNFDLGTLTSDWSVVRNGGYGGVSTHTSKSGIYSMYTNGGVVSITTVPFDTTGITKLMVDYWVRQGNWNFSHEPGTGEDLIVEYLNASNIWKKLDTFYGSALGGTIYDKKHELVGDALHTCFRLRFRQTGGSGINQDYWHIDDVKIQPPPIPTLHVSWRDKAQLTAEQADLMVNMANISALAQYEDIELLSISMNLTGTGSSSDLEEVCLVLDLDFSGNYTYGDQIVKSGKFVEGKLKFTGPWTILKNTFKTFVVTFNISNEAVIGNTVGVRIKNNDIVVKSPAIIKPSFVIQSKNMTINERRDLLEVIVEDKSPFNAEQGENDVVVMQIKLKALSNFISLYSIRLDFIGTGRSNDIKTVKIIEDVDQNGGYDNETDVLVSSSYFLGSTLQFTGLGININDTWERHFLILFDIKAEAQIGRTLGTAINWGYIVVDNPDLVKHFSQCWAGPFTVSQMSDRFPPAAPIQLAIEEITHNSIFLSWAQNLDDDVVGYYIYRSFTPDPSDWGQPVGSTPFGEELFNDTGLNEVTKYYYVVTALDEIPNESKFSNMVYAVTLLNPRDPEINNSMLDFSIPEDSYDDSSINLYHWFMDRNNDKLEFRCEWNKNIEVTIFQNNGTVILKPKENWNGKETLIFFAKDNKGEVGDDVVITVTPLNDPPGPVRIISPSAGAEIEYGTPMDLMASCEDPDLIYNDILTFKWSSNISGKLVEGEIINGFILAQGVHLITLEVIDIAGRVARTSINVTILPEFDDTDSTDDTTTDDDSTTDDDTTDDTSDTTDHGTDSEPDDDKAGMLFAWIGVAIIIIILVLVIISFLIIRKKKQTAELAEVEVVPETVPGTPAPAPWPGYTPTPMGMGQPLVSQAIQSPALVTQPSMTPATQPVPMMMPQQPVSLPSLPPATGITPAPTQPVSITSQPAQIPTQAPTPTLSPWPAPAPTPILPPAGGFPTSEPTQPPAPEYAIYSQSQPIQTPTMAPPQDYSYQQPPEHLEQYPYMAPGYGSLPEVQQEQEYPELEAMPDFESTDPVRDYPEPSNITSDPLDTTQPIPPSPEVELPPEQLHLPEQVRPEHMEMGPPQPGQEPQEPEPILPQPYPPQPTQQPTQQPSLPPAYSQGHEPGTEPQVPSKKRYPYYDYDPEEDVY